ncbi:hypothetical protein ABFS82_05G109200 [Erythranthe guttata]|uniref:uncharacterized protein At5g05190-like n=1 Tax=Erythranthe guttata TaxID=4155 RepID=UPI00064DADC4|nr:PREDICTED: uncharacterized protein At5g05190-like [Erythranthe guttata]|eukprot:XP_012834274.1 PREDICTED: uncharacterized protein At5g05190-like [Erythranthe guttata]
MAEAAKVRLVRCPKCENLLPELPDFSIYQCGGCGAVLKAKKKGVVEDEPSEITDDVIKSREISEEDNNIVKASTVEMESSDRIEGGVSDTLHNKGLASNGGSSSSTSLADSDKRRIGKERMARTLESSDEDEYGSYSHGHFRNRNRGKNSEAKVGGGPEYVQDSRPQMEPLRSTRPVTNQWGEKRNDEQKTRFDDFSYHHDEGQSSYNTNSYYKQDSIESLGNGRAELLRKLDELKDQITRSCEITENPSNTRIVPPPSDPYGRHHHGGSHAHGGLPSPQGVVNYGYPQRGYPHEFVQYPNQPEVLRRPPYHHHQPPQSRYTQQQPYHENFNGQFGDVNHDLFMLHRHENFFHQPACSCVHCCDKNWHVPTNNMVDPLDLHNRRAQNELPNRNFHRPHGNNSSNYHPSQSRQSLTLSSNDLDSDKDGLHYHRPRKIVAPHRSVKVGHPIAGGAPFIACSNCFELLKISRKHVSLTKSQQKMKCGACSSIILFELGNKGFIASASSHIDQIPTEIDEGSSGTVDENVRYWNNGSNSANMNGCSNDFDDLGSKFSPTENRSNSGDSEKQLDRLSSNSSLSENEQSPENILSRKPDFPSAKLLPLTKVNSFQEPDSPDNLADNRSDILNKSKRVEEDKVSISRTVSQQSSVRDAAAASEIDVPLNEFSNSYVSHDSVETSKEDSAKVNRGSGDSFFAGLIKKSFRDFRKPNSQVVEDGGSQVFVNGHFIPDRLVKKAEKSAGPIQPGEYWYDKQAGFWGVMGHPCLGIVMPNIEEFNYPIPEKCAAGNTGVFVNGRELHQKDLDLLSSRGLPITKHRSYIVEINGKVVDEQTGEELDGLGKLAPTVERAKHGFGMKVPRFISQSRS